MSEWQPIDTAPKGGARFLFVFRNGFVGIGRYFTKAHIFGADSFGGSEDTEPTHWMPPPDPPDF